MVGWLGYIYQEGHHAVLFDPYLKVVEVLAASPLDCIGLH